MAPRGRAYPAVDAGPRLRRRADRAGRLEDRLGRMPLSRLRRGAIEGPERPRVRRAWRVLFHRPRQAAAARDGYRGGLLRQDRRLVGPRARLPDGDAQRGRLVPDGTILYVAETEAARLWAFPIEEPGVVRKEPWPSPHGGRLVAGMGGYQRFDSLAVQEDGRICVATLVNGGITVISPDGRHTEHHPMPDPMTTNICFGGPDMKTAYITLSWTGRLVAVDWPVAGLRLNHAG